MNNKLTKIILMGNMLEYYDFTIYSVFSITIGATFFIADKPFVQMLFSLAVFAVGFFMRPLGGVLFGHIGDRYGRKIAITYSTFGMAIVTAFIGILPNYERWGLMSTLSLVMLRLAQGLCMGGEGTGVAIFTLEHLKHYKLGLVGGMISASGIAGTFMAIVLGLLLTQARTHGSRRDERAASVQAQGRC